MLNRRKFIRNLLIGTTGLVIPNYLLKGRSMISVPGFSNYFKQDLDATIYLTEQLVEQQEEEYIKALLLGWSDKSPVVMHPAVYRKHFSHIPLEVKSFDE